jgi:hypothetical protein
MNCTAFEAYYLYADQVIPLQPHLLLNCINATPS